MAMQPLALHDDLVFLSPMSTSRADELAAFVGGVGSGLVVDIGCGWAELLLQVVGPRPSLRGLGIDRDAARIAHGKANARARGLQDRVELLVGDGSSAQLPSADALLCIGASQVWGTADTVDLDYSAALTALRALVPRGGRVVYGEGIWSTPPTTAATQALGGSVTEFLTLAELVDLVVRHGFRPLGVGEASTAEWDAFESGYSWGYENWLMSHPTSDPDYEHVRAQAADHRKRWLSGYRNVLGMAYLSLIAD